MDGVAADTHGREVPPGGAAEHQGPGAVHRKRQVLGAERHVGNVCLKLEEPADVRAHKALRSREEQGRRLVVCQKHPAGAVDAYASPWWSNATTASPVSCSRRARVPERLPSPMPST